MGWRAMNTSTPAISKKPADYLGFSLRSLGFYDQRGPGKAEFLAQTVRQIPLRREMQLSRAGRKNDEGGWTDGRLGQVLDLGMVLPAQKFYKAVQLAGANAMGGCLKAFPNQRKQPSRAVPC